jgi:quercetin dioxygenase-like cupin family protein
MASRTEPNEPGQNRNELETPMTTDDDSSAIRVFRDAEVAWFSPPADAGIPGAMAAAVQRKIVTAGPTGGHVTVNEMPAQHVVLPHRHDCDEVIYVLGGHIMISGDDTLTAGDALVIPAQTTYGFRVGDEGVRFLLIRPREASMTMGVQPS